MGTTLITTPIIFRELRAKAARRIPSSLRRFGADTSGSAITLMVAGLIPVMAALGASIDLGRLYMVKSQMQAGVDAAALAGARAYSVTDGSAKSRTVQASSYFYGNFPSTFMSVEQLTPTFTVVDNVNVTTVTATANLPMLLMRIFGINQQQITAVAKAELQPRPLETMVVLDNTGSMRFNLSGGKTRIVALKEAVNSFIDVLYQGGTTRPDLALGFVMYDITANVGAILKTWRSTSVVSQTGFNDASTTAWPTNPLAWKGCVASDQTVLDVNATASVSEANAWDLTRTLPGEGSNPAVEPYFIPPLYVPDLALPSASQQTDTNSAWNIARRTPTSGYYSVDGDVEANNNLYRLDGSGLTQANLLANSALYRSYLYDFYIGLNNGSTNRADDVVTLTNGNYYDPSTGNRTSTTWKINYDKIPRVYDTAVWKTPTTYVVNKDGGKVDNINQNRTPFPSPNWQCPEASVPIAYGRARSFYTDIVNNKNAAIYPGNGTIHHSGLLWGYRLLVRDDAFPRVNPTTEEARRAIVFMTDGENQVGESLNGYTDRTFTWYGQWTRSRVASNAGNTEQQSERRFAKTCANIQREPNPPEIYIIALSAGTTANDNLFNACAPGRVYHADTSAELDQAFKDVAGELVDLHLVQ
jgi:Flp pilus assembly protein TadG